MNTRTFYGHAKLSRGTDQRPEFKSLETEVNAALSWEEQMNLLRLAADHFFESIPVDVIDVALEFYVDGADYRCAAFEKRDWRCGQDPAVTRQRDKERQQEEDADEPTPVVIAGIDSKAIIDFVDTVQRMEEEDGDQPKLATE